VMTPPDDQACRLKSFYSPQLHNRPSFPIKGRIDRIKQIAVAERLVQEFHRSLSERLLPGFFVFLTGDEDDGNRLSTMFQFLLKIKSRHSRHRNIENQTPGLIHIIRHEKLLPRRKSSSRKAKLPEQLGERLAQHLIIVNYGQEWTFGGTFSRIRLHINTVHHALSCVHSTLVLPSRALEKLGPDHAARRQCATLPVESIRLWYGQEGQH